MNISIPKELYTLMKDRLKDHNWSLIAQKAFIQTLEENGANITQFLSLEERVERLEKLVLKGAT